MLSLFGSLSCLLVFLQSSNYCEYFSHHSALYANLRIIRLENYLRVCGDYRTGFSKYSVSDSPIISQFRVYVREIVVLSNAIFVCIAKKLSVTVLSLLCRFLWPLPTICNSWNHQTWKFFECLRGLPDSIFKTLRIRQSHNFSILRRFTRNSPFIQCYLGLHREEVGHYRPQFVVSISLTTPHSMQISP